MEWRSRTGLRSVVSAAGVAGDLFFVFFLSFLVVIVVGAGVADIHGGCGTRSMEIVVDCFSNLASIRREHQLGTTVIHHHRRRLLSWSEGR